MTSKISTRRARGSRGNATAEAALVLLPTFALITAFFDISFAVFNWATMQNAAREGCRYAITFQTSNNNGQDTSIKNIVSANSMGFLPVGSSLIKVNYYSQLAPNTAIPAPNGNLPGNIVEVSVQGYPLNWMIPISGTFAGPYRSQEPTSISVYSRDVLGGYPAGLTSVPR